MSEPTEFATVPLWLKVAHVTSYVGLVLVNVGSGLGWFGKSNKEVSENWPVPITPAGWAFSIWGIIFALQGAGAVYQAIPTGYGNPSGGKEQAALAAGWIQWVWLMQCLWQVFFSREIFAPCVVLILAALAFAVYTQQQLRAAAAHAGGLSWAPTAFFTVPTSINGAWLLAASCVQIMIWFKSLSVGRDALVGVGACCIAAAAATASYMTIYQRDIPWGVTTIWAIWAIASNNRSYQTIWASGLAGLAVTAASTVAAAVLSKLR
eukprot:TRINITY_DN16002_c0_g1_i2.p2 TRINITY_DN16002_c0_g1~~TRINITY_DN16002_c0_g1_i2.p2  ORF type:complete len:292 (+),score=97.76 TRINITY_DN16002_c0_g1_i2:85-876(+)